jgi:tRNA/tmRNA/rRNA uracil-C5-methylase (TrmA/RlmC/RlmD family)
MAGIAARKPSRIVYVSCDPATLQRDLGLLGAHGYGVETALAFDMFPHTPHVEALVRLTRAG